MSEEKVKYQVTNWGGGDICTYVTSKGRLQSTNSRMQKYKKDATNQSEMSNNSMEK